MKRLGNFFIEISLLSGPQNVQAGCTIVTLNDCHANYVCMCEFHDPVQAVVDEMYLKSV